MKFRKLLLAAMVCAMCVGQASALEYSFDAPEDYPFGRPTSQDIVYKVEGASNVDRSKNVALAPPGFGSPTSYLPGSGRALTPNLVPSALSGGLVNQIGGESWSTTDASVSIPGIAASSIGSMDISYLPIQTAAQTIGFTEVTPGLYYSNGSLGTLKIPAIGLTVKVVQGTDSAALAKGVGHFDGTSIWDGNVALAGHNRGTNAYFGKIHTLNAGDTVTLTTQLGTRSYAVTSVEKVSETDTSGTTATSDNRITLYTCVRDESEYRWKVTAVETA